MREKLLEPRPLKNCPVTVELHYANVGSKKPIFGYIYTISSRLVLVLFNENSSCVVFGGVIGVAVVFGLDAV